MKPSIVIIIIYKANPFVDPSFWTGGLSFLTLFCDIFFYHLETGFLQDIGRHFSAAGRQHISGKTRAEDMWQRGHFLMVIRGEREQVFRIFGGYPGKNQSREGNIQIF